MLAEISSSNRTLGYRSAVCATVFSLLYVIGQIAEWLGWLGSNGGPESSSTVLGIIVLLTPSLLLGPSFVVLIASIHEATPHDRKVWSQVAVAFAIAYMVLIGINYFVQLTWVAPRLAAGRIQGMEPFLFVPFDSFLYSVDILGYCLMSVSTFFAAGALKETGLERIARGFLIATGWVLPFLALQMYWHWLIWIAASWAITFPGATWTLAILFRRARIRDLGVEA